VIRETSPHGRRAKMVHAEFDPAGSAAPSACFCQLVVQATTSGLDVHGIQSQAWHSFSLAIRASTAAIPVSSRLLHFFCCT